MRHCRRDLQGHFVNDETPGLVASALTAIQEMARLRATGAITDGRLMYLPQRLGEFPPGWHLGGKVDEAMYRRMNSAGAAPLLVVSEHRSSQGWDLLVVAVKLHDAQHRLVLPLVGHDVAALLEAVASRRQPFYVVTACGEGPECFISIDRNCAETAARMRQRIHALPTHPQQVLSDTLWLAAHMCGPGALSSVSRGLTEESLRVAMCIPDDLARLVASERGMAHRAP